MAAAVWRGAADLFLRALRVCVNYGAPAGYVSAVSGGAGFEGRAAGAGGVRVCVFRQFLFGVDELRDDAFADVFRPGLCVDEGLVPGGGGGVGIERADLGDGGVWVVEATGDLVRGGRCRGGRG